MQAKKQRATKIARTVPCCSFGVLRFLKEFRYRDSDILPCLSWDLVALQNVCFASGPLGLKLASLERPLWNAYA